MALILNIDTSTERAFLFLADRGEVIASAVNDQQMDHASWIHEAIALLMQESGITLSSLDAVAVTAGPGSYTGLRVGFATAKGLCYALKIPLITESKLKVMAAALITQIPEGHAVCAMIDARRMEVFCAVYDTQLRELVPEAPLILEPHSFNILLNERPIVFCGSGVFKWQKICNHPHATFWEEKLSGSSICRISYSHFQEKKFADLAYSEPAYLKEFHTHHKY